MSYQSNNNYNSTSIVSNSADSSIASTPASSNENLKPTKSPRHIPENAAVIEHAHGIVYTYARGSRLLAIAYRGKRSKSDWHYQFRSEEQRNERIKSFFASLDGHVQYKAQQHEQRLQPHTLAVGDVVYNSWGYDQTNVDFYEVVRTSPNYVWLQSLSADLKESGFMAGYVTARPGTRHGEVTQHRVTVYNSSNSVHFKHGAGPKWDSTPKYCSWYA